MQCLDCGDQDQRSCGCFTCLGRRRRSQNQGVSSTELVEQSSRRTSRFPGTESRNAGLEQGWQASGSGFGRQRTTPSAVVGGISTERRATSASAGRDNAIAETLQDALSNMPQRLVAGLGRSSDSSTSNQGTRRRPAGQEDGGRQRLRIQPPPHIPSTTEVADTLIPGSNPLAGAPPSSLSLADRRVGGFPERFTAVTEFMMVAHTISIPGNKVGMVLKRLAKRHNETVPRPYPRMGVGATPCDRWHLSAADDFTTSDSSLCKS